MNNKSKYRTTHVLSGLILTGLVSIIGVSSLPASAKMTPPTQISWSQQYIQQQIDSLVAETGNIEMKKLGESLIDGAPTKVVYSTPKINRHSQGHIYYVSPYGNDQNNGRTPRSAWQSIDKINQTTFHPGDEVLFQAGGEWFPSEPLHPLGSGVEKAPIVIGAYGMGPKPKISGKNISNEWTFTDGSTEYESDVIYLENQEYIEIRDLDISNAPDSFTGVEDDDQKAMLADRRGIHIVGANNTTETELKGFWLHDLYIHDVAGESHTISATGWDPSKRTAGILIETIVKGNNGLPVIDDPVDVSGYEPTYFSDVLIESNVLVNTSYGGIIVKQLEAWGARDNSNDTPYYDVNGWYPNTYITIQNNYLDNDGTDYGADTIYLTCARYSLIRNNVSHGAGTSAIELYYTDSVTVEYNEVYGARQKVTGADSNAIDPDTETTNALIQYNYVHDNGDGILLCGSVYGSSVIRYNVIQDSDSSKRYLNIHGRKGYNYIYNNIFYNSTDSDVTFVYSSGGSSYLNSSVNLHYIANNIFYSPYAKATVGDGTGVTYTANAYYNVESVPDEDTMAVPFDPDFLNVSAIKGGEGERVDLTGLRLMPYSTLIDAGMPVTSYNNTAISADEIYDFAGQWVDPDHTDIGIFEFSHHH